MAELSKMFSDHMVFQRNKPVRVFGSGFGDISVEFCGNTANAKQCENECWLAELPAQEAGGPYTLTVIIDGNTSHFSDVYVGEVILLAGQSNIQWPLGWCNTPPEVFADNEKLRAFTVTTPVKDKNFTSNDGWVKCAWDTCGHWSTIGFYLGNMMTSEKDIVVGLVCCYQSASNIQTWLPREITGKPEYQVKDRVGFKDSVPEFVEINADSIMYDASFTQILPYSVKCCIWYQGEANAGPEEAAIYADLLTELIDRWRNDLKDEKLDFYIIQIADYKDWFDTESWKKIQEAQKKVADTMPNTYLIESKDISCNDNIHPPEKEALARRIFGALN